ncbi:unnamed protein product [Schistosoma margrebowiei]|uniref:Uncharacterized protein n=1 Tax=Schistosoma margrebowiei TaxID=48269 RepID=A0A183MV50_9TREM|nr:unnamed protein product [Schistosoma margrebowiei]
MPLNDLNSHIWVSSSMKSDDLIAGRKGDYWRTKDITCTVEEHMELKTTVSTKTTSGSESSLRTYMEGNWKGIKGALTSTCQEILGLKKHHHKDWISIETLDKIKERKNRKTAINNSRARAEKFQAQAEYIEANKQVKKSIRVDKKKYVQELTTTAEKAAREGNMKQLYDTAKKLAGKYSKLERLVKDKEGKPNTEIQQQRNRWVEYFEKLLNRPAPMNPPDIEAAHIDLPIDVNPPTKEEIRMAIRQIKSGKVAGLDNIPAEALNNSITLDGETLDDVESITYPRSIIDEQGGSDADVKGLIPTVEEYMELKTTVN